MTALQSTTHDTAASLTFAAKNPAISAKAPGFDQQLASAYQGLEGDVTDVFYAGEILQHLMHDMMSDEDPTPLTRHEMNMLLHAMYLVTNRASELKEKYYAGYTAVPTEGTA